MLPRMKDLDLIGKPSAEIIFYLNWLHETFRSPGVSIFFSSATIPFLHLFRLSDLSLRFSFSSANLSLSSPLETLTNARITLANRLNGESSAFPAEMGSGSFMGWDENITGDPFSGTAVSLAFAGSYGAFWPDFTAGQFFVRDTSAGHVAKRFDEPLRIRSLACIKAKIRLAGKHPLFRIERPPLPFFHEAG